MAQIIYAPRALDDLDRFFEFLSDDVAAASKALSLIAEAISMLERHPMIGRKVEGGLRELVISHGAVGCIAIYRHLPEHDVVLVLALRHQREAGYQGE